MTIQHTIQEPVLLASNPPEQMPPGTTIHEYSLNLGGHSKSAFHTAKFEVSPQTIAAPDVHDVRELWFVTAGTAELLSNGKKVPLEKDMVFFFDSRVPHQISNTSDVPLKVITIWWPPGN